ncbi:MAG: recombinase zinc beta ribbon domain-containing protein [Eubacteriales bacterium]|nr:recombinase zinc beta ribbon domain-containing protein [Eubacteriales bacterium]
MNGSSFHFGIPGSGKSFGCKDEMTQIALSTDDDILVCDPEREYGFLREFGAEIIHIAAGSDDHINAMDMVEGYSDTKNPIAQKSQFIMSLLEQLDQTRELTSIDKSIIDRCTGDVYRNYRNGGPLPTLPALREVLLTQPEPEARDLALSLELFTKGSLNAFAYPTNVNTQCRILVYDILDLGEQLKTMGLLVITDAILNRVTENWRAGRRTHVYLDEFHVVYENPYSSMFFTSAWRRFRKRNAFPTGITQNVEYLLDNTSARSMLSNSEFIVMHNQAASDREKLAVLFNISEQQMSYITNAEAGHGLMKIGNALVPFVNRFPKNTELYRRMTTIIGKDSWAKVQKKIASGKSPRVTKSGEISLFAGIARCADCGASMTFNTKQYDGRTYYIYKCSRYAVHGKSTCSIHHIPASALEEAVLQNIRFNAQLLSENDEELLEKLIALGNRGQQCEMQEAKAKLNKAVKRLEIVEGMAQKLFEERCTGNVPDSVFKKLMQNYDIEQANLNHVIAEKRNTLMEIENASVDISAWAEEFKQYTNIDKLNRKIVTKLIDSVEVHESTKENGVIKQHVTVNYKFVGQLSA